MSLLATEAASMFGKAPAAVEAPAPIAAEAEQSPVGDEAEAPEGDPAGDVAPPADGTEAAAPASESLEETITITDDQGRRSVKVNWNDREKLKQYVQLAAGAHKWRKERDASKKEIESLRTDFSKTKETLNVLQEAFQSQGIEGVVDLLSGKKGALKDLQAKAIEEARFRENASPQELKDYEARQAAEQLRQEVERVRKENEQLRQTYSSDKERASVEALQAQVFPVFEKYRFAGKLDSAVDEHFLDTAIWTAASEKLSHYESSKIPLTPELIEKEFKEAASVLQRRINGQASKKAAKVLESRKVEAASGVQARVKSSTASPSVAREADSLLESGRVGDIFKSWGKYGTLFNKR